MANKNIGLLHPGAMGISVAASAKNSGYEVYWVSEGRSANTRKRAEEYGLREVSALAELCSLCPVIISVCPPHAAEDVATAVIKNGFRGLYVDGNAISPQRAERIEQIVVAGGASFVDGGIIGGPAWEPQQTWLYLSGERAEEVRACFSAGPLEAEVISPRIGDASALKMCFAAYTKGTSALLTAILATAEELGVRQALEKQWSRGGSDFAGQTQQRVRRVTAKAWRFAAEMEEIAATFEAAGLPPGFHIASAEIYRRLAGFKDAPDLPELEAVLAEAQKM